MAVQRYRGQVTRITSLGLRERERDWLKVNQPVSVLKGRLEFGPPS